MMTHQNPPEAVQIFDQRPGERLPALENVARALVVASQGERAFVSQIPLTYDQRLLTIRQSAAQLAHLATSNAPVEIYDFGVLVVTIIAQALVLNERAASVGGHGVTLPQGVALTREGNSSL